MYHHNNIITCYPIMLIKVHQGGLDIGHIPSPLPSPAQWLLGVVPYCNSHHFLLWYSRLAIMRWVKFCACVIVKE